MDKDYKLAEHLIAHLQQDDVLAPMVCPTVWDEQEQIDAINRAAMGRPGSVAVTPAGYVPLLEMGVNAPMVRMHAVLAVSCFARDAGMPGGVPRVCYDTPSVASVEDYDMTKSRLTGFRGRAVILYAPVNF